MSTQRYWETRDELNAYAEEVVEELAKPYEGSPLWVLFTGFKAAQGSVFICGQWLFWPSASKEIGRNTPLFYANVPAGGLGVYKTGENFMVEAPSGEQNFTGKETREQIRTALEVRFKALMEFFQKNPPDWMTTEE